MMLRVAALGLLSIAIASPVPSLDTSVNQFSLQLLDYVFAGQEGFSANFVTSPLSVWNLLSLITQGAAGDTFQELSSALRLPKESAETRSVHRLISGVLNGGDQDVVVERKGAMFTECNLKVHEDFCREALEYSTDLFSVETYNTTRLAHDINLFVCLATNGKIKNIVNEEFVVNLKLLLVDAIYFKANWTSPFYEKETTRQDFYDQLGRSIGSVDMMQQKAPHRREYVDELESDLLELTYGRNEQFSMVIFLPFEGVPLKRVLNHLSTVPSDTWRRKLNAVAADSVECYVPRFKISSNIDLVKPLQYMGVVSVFDDAKAELPGISDTPLFVSKTIQKVELEVNEQGTVAAAATVIQLENRIGKEPFIVNRPFAFAILERASGLILFSGVYSDPSAVE